MKHQNFFGFRFNIIKWAVLLLLCLLPFVGRSQSDSTVRLPESKVVGSSLYETGKTLMWTAASVSLTSMVFYLGHCLNPEESGSGECHSTDVSLLVPMAGLASGAALVLVGLPCYLLGKGQINRSGSDFIVSYDDLPGLTGIFELSGGLPPFIGYDAILGWQFQKALFLGAGAGYRMMSSSGDNIPLIYANGRYSFDCGKSSPYLGLRLGYTAKLSERYLSFESGAKIRTSKGKEGMTWWIGSQVESLSKDDVLLSLKLSASFSVSNK